MPVKVNFSSVEERDMDTFFLEAFGTDKDFLQLFLNKIESLKNSSFEVISIELSKSDRDGESDITVIIEGNGKKHGLLIEDKINAKAMPKQCSRYTTRGKTGVKNGDYKDFFVFIVSPEKYYKQNEEAKKYDHFVSYEECLKYLKTKNDAISNIWIQQIEQSIEKVKNTAPITKDEKRIACFKKYLEYQERYYPELQKAGNIENVSNPSWVQYIAEPNNAYILHKTKKGQFDLTFNGKTTIKPTFDFLMEHIHKMGFTDIKVVKTGNSIALRIVVPPINFDDNFESIDKNDLDKCFKAGCELKRLADIIKYFADICGES